MSERTLPRWTHAIRDILIPQRPAERIMRLYDRQIETIVHGKASIHFVGETAAYPMCMEVLKNTRHPYAIEFGFGEVIVPPPRYLPDGNPMPTFCFEPENFRLEAFRRSLEWQNKELYGTYEIFICPISFPNELYKTASTLVYRNPDIDGLFGSDTPIPRKNDLIPGQRMVLICDSCHICEFPIYNYLADAQGYDHTMWRCKRKTAPFERSEKDGDFEYILDYTAPTHVVIDPCEE